jgi:c(7)-type cytochrome triheme protein
MRSKVIWMVAAFPVFTVGLAYGAPMHDIIYQGHTASDEAVFHGDKHLKRGITCEECHNREMFPKKKKGATIVTMKAIREGKLCGKCHNGKVAFGIDHKCDKCHPKKGPDTVIYD